MIYIYKDLSKNKTTILKQFIESSNLVTINIFNKIDAKLTKENFPSLLRLNKDRKELIIETNIQIIELKSNKDKIQLQRNEYILSIVELNKDNNYYLIYMKD